MEKSIQNQLKVNDVTFWMMMDGKRIDFEVYDVTDVINKGFALRKEPYQIDQSVIIRPILPDAFKFNDLFLKSDATQNGFIFEDWASDEYYDASLFKNHQVMMGLGLQYFDDLMDDETRNIQLASVDNKKIEAVYSDMDSTVKNELLFQISYKSVSKYLKLSPEVDLSLDFSFDTMIDFYRDSLN